MCMLMAAAALSYHLLLGVTGLLSFGHALYFGAGVYGLGVILDTFDIQLLPAMGLTLLLVIVLAHVVGAVGLRVTGIPFAMVTLAFAEAGHVLVGRNPGQATGGEEGLTLATENLPEALLGVANTAQPVLAGAGRAAGGLRRGDLGAVQSRAGHVAAAVRENELRVRVIGLRPTWSSCWSSWWAACWPRSVGMVYLLLQSGAVPRSLSADFTITLLVMVVLGGVGSAGAR